MWMSEMNNTPNYAPTHLRTPKICTNTADDSARSGFGFISADIVYVNVYFRFHSTADNVITFPNEEKLFVSKDRTIKLDLGSTVYINDAKVEGCVCVTFIQYPHPHLQDRCAIRFERVNEGESSEVNKTKI